MLSPGLTFFDRRSTTQCPKLDRLIGLGHVCGIFLVCGILFGGEAVAVPPNAPVIIGDNVIRHDDNANRIIAILDNYAVPSILSGLQYPADPVTTTTREVRNNSELAAAVDGDGRLIRIYGPGNGGQSTYAQFNLGGRSDIDIVMDNDATIVGPSGWGWWGPVRRIRWTGGNVHINSGSTIGLRVFDAEDVMWDNVLIYRDTGAGASGAILNPQGDNHRRWAMINSSVENRVGSNTNAYSMFAYTVGPASDWIYLNNRFKGQGPPVRWIRMGDRVAIVGNYFDFSTEDSNGGVRIHRDTDGMWFAYNYVVHSSGNQPILNFQVADVQEPLDQIMNDVWVENNKYFANQSNMFTPYRFGDAAVPSNRDQATNWVIRNNRWSDPNGPAGGESFGGGIEITVPYVREGDLRVGPGHPDYETDPGPSGFGARR